MKYPFAFCLKYCASLVSGLVPNLFSLYWINLNSSILLCPNSGLQEVNNESKCSNEICYNINSNAFLYEDGVCKCFDNEGQTIYQEVLSWIRKEVS